MTAPPVLFSAEDIRVRLETLADTLAALPDAPQVMAPILVGAFVFAADLGRALAARGVHTQTEMIWLRSYGNARTGSALSVLAAPSDHVRGKHVLLIDGVLDTGLTIQRATRLLQDVGAVSIRTVVAVDKQREDAVARADYALYTGVKEFIVGYGMDDAGLYRALPYIGKIEE